jgi:hypothetical protein
MKHNVIHPDLVLQYSKATPEERRELIFLAFEAEFDANRPFTLQWGPEDKYFGFEGYTYVYKPQYPEAIDETALGLGQFESESPHFVQYK